MSIVADLIDVTTTVCFVRGLFVEQTYKTTFDAVDQCAEGVENPFAKGFILGFVGTMTLPAISMVEGAKALYRDGEKLYDKLTGEKEQSDRDAFTGKPYAVHAR